MTAKEKAKDLIIKMEGGCCRCPIDSKEAALTCCDEIIEEYKLINTSATVPYETNLSYWMGVKTHIQQT